MCKQSGKKPYDKKPAYPPKRKSTFNKEQHKNQFISVDQPTSEEPATSQEEWDLFALSTTSGAGIKVDMELNGTNMSIIPDTGASVTLISRKTWKEKFPNIKLDKSGVVENLLRRTASGVRANPDARGLQATEGEFTFLDCSRRWTIVAWQELAEIN